MRHLLSVLLALVLSPIIYACAGYSAVKLADATGDSSVNAAPAALGLLAALAAGGLYAILVMARLSPVGPVLAGLAFLGVTLWALIDLERFNTTVPANIFGAPDALHLPAGMPTALLAAPLLATVVSPRRWRRDAQAGTVTHDAASPYTAAPAYPTAATSAAPTYGSPTSEASSYTPPVYTPSGYRPQSPGGDGEEPPTKTDIGQ